ncbi:MAG: deoxyguanosinetriphosphate triphosphohydrolase, partial [Eubacteriales bacterium]|nr:deoxyguanosinetriphosphate triphosphohydrolase [Eubacteriales bacterium]
VYRSEKLEKERQNFEFMLKELYKFYTENFDKVPYEFSRVCEKGEKKETAICDYIAGMTDRYATRKYDLIKNILL